ncbi:hypothetical protein CAMSH0001_0224 [Campylobacter showae RM3277]|uniref:Uncharacterized protein n=1 Tax=Campylobacter showae RM3277 TaxID=553219 RepID=C6RI72_9BACT|nr:hypothetical protein CAMSH0001_0224 [Campylobacter showae RM3277]
MSSLGTKFTSKHLKSSHDTSPYCFGFKFEVKFVNFGFKFYPPRPAPQKR